MDDRIIERLIEINEKRNRSADVKFYVTCVLLLISLIGNIYQASLTNEITIDNVSSFESSDNNTNNIVR